MRGYTHAIVGTATSLFIIRKYKEKLNRDIPPKLTKQQVPIYKLADISKQLGINANTVYMQINSIKKILSKPLQKNQGDSCVHFEAQSIGLLFYLFKINKSNNTIPIFHSLYKGGSYYV